MLVVGARQGVVRLLGAVLAVYVALVPSGLIARAAEGAPPAPGQESCRYGATSTLTQVSGLTIREASALVASQNHPGIYWTLNDAHNTPTIYAFDESGHPRGTFQVPGATNVDWEAMQLGPDGNGGYALYIGDVGDNDYRRRAGTIYRVPEPEPSPAGAPPVATVTDWPTVFQFVFPTRAANVEAMLVHPKTGEIELVTKSPNGLSLMYRLPAPQDPNNAMMLELDDIVDLRGLDPSSGLITDAAVSPDARQVVLRTYASVLLFDVPPGASLGSIWDQQPRVSHLSDGPKGEGITFKFNSADLVSIGEGTTTFLYQTAWQC